jgi:hypothetical protein
LEYLLEAKEGYKASKSKKDKETFKKTLTEIVNIVNNAGLLAKQNVEKLTKAKVGMND